MVDRTLQNWQFRRVFFAAVLIAQFFLQGSLFGSRLAKQARK
jgi:hypothetical protein